MNTNIKETDMTTTTITARARFFSRIESRKCRVEDGRVLVWDDVAGHYTRCHSLSKRSESRIAHLASDWCPLCGTTHPRGEGPAGYSCEAGR
jgi:hypothetical protein